MNWKKILLGLGVLVVLGFGGFQTYLYSIKYYADKPVFQTASGAIDGYDAVAYFTESKPVMGKAEFSTEWNGARWQFANAQNLALFSANPEGYAPQFGGYCAFAVGRGYTAKSDPLAWHVQDGKLYLNYNPEVQQQWMTQRSELIAAGVRNWPGVLED